MIATSVGPAVALIQSERIVAERQGGKAWDAAGIRAVLLTADGPTEDVMRAFIVAAHDPALLREILALSLESFEENRHSYHLSCDTAKIPTDVPDDRVGELVTAFDSRQVMHVGYGAVLDAFGPQIKGLLVEHEDEYATLMKEHFLAHLTPFGAR